MEELLKQIKIAQDSIKLAENQRTLALLSVDAAKVDLQSLEMDKYVAREFVRLVETE